MPKLVQEIVKMSQRSVESKGSERKRRNLVSGEGGQENSKKMRKRKKAEDKVVDSLRNTHSVATSLTTPVAVRRYVVRETSGGASRY
jgi:hypothetical protein